ncbi:MAG TPA: GNAT family N-acetyltransferase [Opitutaceae bacterium]
MSEILSFRAYETGDRDACLGIFDANCPAWFAPNERADYCEFLDRMPAGYEVVASGGRVVAAFGLLRPAATWHLNWIMVSPDAHGRGVGRAIMQRVTSLVTGAGGGILHIGASHRSAPFFAKFGATDVRHTHDGWGPGMHRIDMVLDVSRSGARPA